MHVPTIRKYNPIMDADDAIERINDVNSPCLNVCCLNKINISKEPIRCMFQRCWRRLVAKTLSDGTRLDGTFHETIVNRLLSGVAVLPDGRCFKGTFDASSGAPLPGSQLEEDGDLYVGAFNPQWQRHGVGEAWLADGTHYKGTFQNDELVKGEVRIPSGVTEVVFRGTLKDEEFAEGTLKQHDFTYTGSFLSNRPHGKGSLVFANGATQEGTFFDGGLHGENCTMRLEGGFVYVGSFVDGKIKRGMLYTPTYTYDGEFDDQGKAHGEGTQIHLASSPKLTFTGIWHHGNLIRGTCVDEHGAPVDWQDRHDLQEAVLDDDVDRKGALQVQKLCETKLKEADMMHRAYQQAYVHDADKIQKESGVRPSKHDLGYEHSVRGEHEAIDREMMRQQRSFESSKQNIQRNDTAFATRADFDEDAEHHRVDVNKAKLKMMTQAGAQQVMSDRMEEQLKRFMQDQQEDQHGDGAQEKRGLRIDGNPTWKNFTSS
jgi:hypothetical protein